MSSNPSPIPLAQPIHEFVEGVFGLCKRAVAGFDEKEQELAQLKEEFERVKKATESGGPVVRKAFDHEEARAYAEKLKKAQLLPRKDIDLEKLATYIVRNPQWLVDQLLETHLPPEEQGYPANHKKQSSDEAYLVDYDGWVDCIANTEQR